LVRAKHGEQMRRSGQLLGRRQLLGCRELARLQARSKSVI
jgi:hypothetical protein